MWVNRFPSVAEAQVKSQLLTQLLASSSFHLFINLYVLHMTFNHIHIKKDAGMSRLVLVGKKYLPVCNKYLTQVDLIQQFQTGTVRH